MGELIYIYNLRQARYFLKNGLNICDIGVHKKTKQPYWVFKKTHDKFNVVFDEWIDIKDMV